MLEILGRVVCWQSSEAGIVDIPLTTGGPMHNYKFSKPKDLVLHLGSKSEKTVTSIGDVIKASGADKLFGHAPFLKGVPPPSFALKKDMTFQPKEQSDQLAIQVAMKATKVSLLWVMAVDSTNKVLPKGLAIVTTVQILLKPGEDFVL